MTTLGWLIGETCQVAWLTCLVVYVHLQIILIGVCYWFIVSYWSFSLVSVCYLVNSVWLVYWMMFPFPYRLTGFSIPPPVTSTGSVFSLRLTSDFAVSAHGFKLYYEGKSLLLCPLIVSVVYLLYSLIKWTAERLLLDGTASDPAGGSDTLFWSVGAFYY